MIKRIVRLLYQLLWDVIKEVFIKAALIIVRLCHCRVRTSWVDPSANYAEDIVYLPGLNLWRGWMEIPNKTAKYICANIINCMINVTCIALALCSTSWTKLLWDPQLTSVPGRQTMVDSHPGEGDECQDDFINQRSVFHSHLMYATEVCPVNIIHNVSHCKSKLSLLNWFLRQQ